MYWKNVIQNIHRDKNQIIYDEDMYKLYSNVVRELYRPQKNQYEHKYKCIYIDTQTNKEIIITAIEEIKGVETKIKNATQEELINILIAVLHRTKLIIFYNYFEDLTNPRELLFKRLMRNNILFVAGFQEMPKKSKMSFFKEHIFVNKDYYESQIGENNIDITYFFYLFITLFLVLMFLRIVSLGEIGNIVSSALWFGLLIFRTFSYIGGKV